MKIDLVVNTIKSHFHDVLIATAGMVQERKTSTTPKFKPAYLQTDDEKVEQAMSVFGKVKDTVLDQLDIKNKPVKEQSFEEKYTTMTDSDLRVEYEKLRNKSIKEPNNEELRKHCEYIVKELRSRE